SGAPFSGTIVTNSVSYSGTGNNTDLGTSVTGVQLNSDISGLNTSKEYKWRARVQYSPVNNPYQKYSPWKYYNNYIPSPLGNFRPSNGVPEKILNLTMLVQGLYDAGTNTTVQDTVTVYLRNSFLPYSLVDSAKAFLSTAGAGVYSFSNALNGVSYYIQLKHRNSIETWSNTAPSFIGNAMTYDFTTAVTQAYGSNMINADASPVRFAIYNGDINQDGIVDAGDLSPVENDATEGMSGYVLTDVTGDDYVDAGDLSIVENNAAAGIYTVTP
ncbi:MAG: hypothetical protein JNJ56_13410, partial [Ignavibacteria bacterium]|nr:hypothetical protein [Ignavibacteria bacterium]